ncbi:MAG: AraC family transcriptional regulator [Spirochaetaceae bacterium]|nr:MAG: AraC family transcriptional regulator [Spirochaetaceae bacterium]
MTPRPNPAIPGTAPTPASAPTAIDVALKSQPPRYQNAIRDYRQFYLIAVTRGSLFYSDASGTIAVGPGRMVVLRFGSSFTLSTAAGYSGVSVDVRPPTGGLLEGASFVAARSERIASTADWIESELSLPAGGSRRIASSLGRVLVELALRDAGVAVAGEPDEARSLLWARRAKEAIGNSIYTTMSVQQVLAGFPVSYRQIARYVGEHYRVSPKRLQLDLRMEAARRLLTETHWSVTTIAMELGFGSAQHFSNAFGRAHGSPPGVWRARLDPSDCVSSGAKEATCR